MYTEEGEQEKNKGRELRACRLEGGQEKDKGRELRTRRLTREDKRRTTTENSEHVN